MTVHYTIRLVINGDWYHDFERVFDERSEAEEGARQAESKNTDWGDVKGVVLEHLSH